MKDHQTPQTQVSLNAHESQIAGWMRKLTLPEKVGLLAGASMWQTVPVERLGIPSIKVSDGPNGARGSGGLVGGSTTSACFPVGISLAATWNTELIGQVGKAIGEEAHTKNARMILGPTVNIHRSPLNGRNFECFSEDPYLSAGDIRILRHHILPNIASTVLVLITIQFRALLLFESALSFLGLGVPPPNPSWGSMINDGRDYLLSSWWISVFPGIALMLTVLTVSLIGDWLRDALDPTLRHLR